MAGFFNRFKRKSLKLVRDPKKFFADSKILGAPKTKNPEIQKIEIKKVEAKPVVNKPIKKNVEVINVGDKYIKFPDFAPINHRLSSIFFVSKTADKVFSNELKKQISATHKFSGFRPENIFLAEYVGDYDLTANEILVKIDKKNKERIEGFQSVIFCDDFSNFPIALKYCNHQIRFVLVLSEGSSIPEDYDVTEIDTLICHESYDGDTAKIKAVLRYQSHESQIAALKDCLNQAAIKPFNVLLPVWGEVGYAPEILDYDTKRVEALLVLKKAYVPKMHRKFSEVLPDISSKIKTLYLCEEKFLRYKNLVLNCKNQDDLSRLVAATLKDGVRYEVQS